MLNLQILFVINTNVSEMSAWDPNPMAIHGGSYIHATYIEFEIYIHIKF
jgi:hypothetical protein